MAKRRVADDERRRMADDRITAKRRRFNYFKRPETKSIAEKTKIVRSVVDRVPFRVRGKQKLRSVSNANGRRRTVVVSVL